MGRTKNAIGISVLLISALAASLLPPCGIGQVSAFSSKLTWAVADTPAPDTVENIIVSPSEINALAVGSDGETFYAVDIPGDLGGGTYPDGKVYKSTDSGVTWEDDLSGFLTADGANLPAWDIVIAPDDPDFVVVVTSDAIGLPREVFISTDGGANWSDTGLGTIANIGCIDISMEYGSGHRDIAIGTRTGIGIGNVYVLKTPSFGGWIDQGFNGDVVALKFSPAYTGDYNLVVVSASMAGTWLNLGDRDVVANSTVWNDTLNYPVSIIDTDYAGVSPTAAQIITADLELPSDFAGTDPGQLRYYYISIDAIAAGAQSGGYYINNTEVYWITSAIDGRISTIAYHGTHDNGKLLAGEVTNDLSLGMVNIWRCANVEVTSTVWYKSDIIKSPSGGGNSGYANAQVVWSPDGGKAYCGTSSALLINSLSWPLGFGLGSVALDESAFSVSLDGGYIWNQLSLIDTEISFLSDVAAVQAPEDSEDYDVLYLSSCNTDSSVTYSFDSVWRSISDPLGRTWERVLFIATSDTGTILRFKPRTSEEDERTEAVVFADRSTSTVKYSPNEGQCWQNTNFSGSVTDLTLSSESVMFILDDAFVTKGNRSGAIWLWKSGVATGLDYGHTICTPLKNPEGKFGEEAEWVIVGGAYQGDMAYADFSQVYAKFEPSALERVIAPVPGNMHVIADEKFEQNNIIYAAINDISGTNGKIYRWTIGKSTAWDELKPPNSAFYGLAQRKGVLYGVWDNAVIPDITTDAGVDRTLYSRKNVPPPIDWDDLTVGLPVTGEANYPVAFTREPTALKISSNGDNSLWAIDNHDYDWANKIGCLWVYTDTMARVGPWATSPASEDFILVDPVSGRATEVNFRWRQLIDAEEYELQLSKDNEFSMLMPDTITEGISQEFIVPSDPLSPVWILPPGILETNHVFYWRVRASKGTTGEVIHSPWSATMSFTVKAGLPVTAEHLGIKLFEPGNGDRCVLISPSFSWSHMPKTTKYEFILAKDAAMTQIVAKAAVPTSAYKYAGKLDWSTAYFWQVRAIEPIVSDPSPVATFIVEAKEIPPVPAPPSSPDLTPFWIWIMIAVYTVLMIVVIGLIKAKPLYVRPEREIEGGKRGGIIEKGKSAIAGVWNAITVKIGRRHH